MFFTILCSIYPNLFHPFHVICSCNYTKLLANFSLRNVQKINIENSNYVSGCKRLNHIILRQQANAQNLYLRNSIWWPIYIINSVDKINEINSNAAPQFLLKLTLLSIFMCSSVDCESVKEHIKKGL